MDATYTYLGRLARIKRSGKNNTRIIFEDGTEETVPSNLLVEVGFLELESSLEEKLIEESLLEVALENLEVKVMSEEVSSQIQNKIVMEESPPDLKRELDIVSQESLNIAPRRVSRRLMHLVMERKMPPIEKTARPRVRMLD